MALLKSLTLIITLSYLSLLHHTQSEEQATCSVDGSDTDCNKPSPCQVNEWISQNGTVPGYHVLCITKDTTNPNALNIEFYRHGVASSTNSGQYISDSITMKQIRKELERILKITKTDAARKELPQKDRPNKWGIFTPEGIRIIDLQLLRGTLLVFEGGVWIYPAIHIGFERDVVITDESNQETTFKLVTLSVHPPVFQVLNFIKPSDCDHIVSISSAHMKRSGVSHMHNTDGDANQWRTSTTHWLRDRDDIIDRIELHCSKLLHIPKNNQELIQVLRYEPTQQYDSHWDYFDPKLYKGTAMEQKIRGGRNRVATLFWYMSDVTDGGWTYFPRSGKLPNPPSYKLKEPSDCDSGLKVEPRKGGVVLFYSMKPDGNVDPLSLHGACPVGEDNLKWGANIWYWTKDANNY